MKSIPNKQTEIKINDSNANYSDLIRLVINQGKQGGFDYSDIENRLAISKALNENPENIELEDAQFLYLKKLVETMKWNIYHANILQFKEDILSVK